MSSDCLGDLPLQEVAKALLAIPNFKKIVVCELRRALDEVIDGPRTGRFSVAQLEKTEKTYIGTKVEILLRHALQLERGEKLDNRIAGHEVDTKFSISSDWMIPKEAIGEICLLVTVDDNRSVCAMGLLRTTDEHLRPGKNQDSKKGISAAGKQRIRWLLKEEPISLNILLHLPKDIRTAILSPRSGRGRVEALFTHVTNQVLPRSVVLQVIRLPGDPLKRAREAKANLLAKGIKVMCAAYREDRDAMMDLGYKDLSDSDWLSVRVDRL